MKEIKIKLYKFDELSEEAQKKVIEREQNYRYENNHPWSDSDRETLDSFCEIFPVKWESWDEYNIFWKYTGEDYHKELSGVRLISHLWNGYKHALYKGKYYSAPFRKVEKDKEHPAGLAYTKRHSRITKDTSCVLTGYYMDDTILAPIYKVLDGEDLTSTFLDVLEDCMEAFRKANKAEQENWQSEKAIIEELKDLDHDYEEDGSVRHCE